MQKKTIGIYDILIIGAVTAGIAIIIAHVEFRTWSLQSLYALSLAAGLGSAILIGTRSSLQMWSSGFMYIVALVIFHLGIPIVRLTPFKLNSIASQYTNLWFIDDETTRMALSLSIAAVSAFTVGYLISSRQTVVSASADFEPKPQFAFVGAALVVAGSVWYMGYAAVAAPLLYLGAGKSYYEATIAGAGPVALGTILVSIGIPILTAAPKSKLRQVALAVFWIFAAFTLAIGSRTAALYAIVGFFVVLARLRKMPRNLVATFGLIFGLTLINGIRQIRDVGWANSSFSDVIGSPLAALHETGSSLRPLIETIQKLESGEFQLRSGQTYFVGIIRAFERIMGIERPTPDPRWPASIVTERDDGYQIGFSTIAEGYLNFGGWGLIILFFSLGLLFNRMDSRNLGSPLTAARVGLVFIALLSVVRQGSNIMFTMLILGWIAIEIARRLPTRLNPSEKPYSGRVSNGLCVRESPHIKEMNHNDYRGTTKPRRFRTDQSNRRETTRQSRNGEAHR